jgi:hypothetical protein
MSEEERREKAARKLDTLLAILEKKRGSGGSLKSDIHAILYICRLKPRFVVRVGAEDWELFDAARREFPDIDEVIEAAERAAAVFKFKTPKNRYYVLL